jgi:hypothetical protein
LLLPVVELEGRGTAVVVVLEDSIVHTTFLFRTAVTQLPLGREDLDLETVLSRKPREETQVRLGLL